jgi:hypothetical protein
MVTSRVMVFVAALAAVGCSLVNAPDSHTRGRSGADGGADGGVADGGSTDAGSTEADGGSITDAGSTEPPLLRVAHLARDNGPVDVYANGALIAEGIDFAAVGASVEVPAGDVLFRVLRAGTEALLAEQTFEASLGRRYTLTFYGDEVEPPFGDRTLDLLLLDDDASGLDITRSIRLAVVHVATPVVAGQLVAVTPDGNLLLANDFGFSAVARLRELAATSYTVGFDAGADGTVDLEFDLPSLVPGTYANVFVATRPDGSVFLLVNTQLGATLTINPNP